MLAVLVPVGMAQEAGATCSVPGQIVTEPDAWTAIRAPNFPTGPKEIVSYAVDPVSPERIFVTNGKALMRSTDGGCTWSTVLAVPDGSTPDFPVAATMKSIVVPASGGTGGRVHYLLVEEPRDVGEWWINPPPSVGPQLRFFIRSHRSAVFLSRDGGTTWQRSSPPDGADLRVSPYGQPLALSTAEGNASVVYLATALRAVSTYTNPDGTLVYMSPDGGLTWQLQTPVDSVAAGELPPVFLDMQVDPLDPGVVWAGSENGLWRSEDGGRHWERVAESHISGHTYAVDVFHKAGSPARVWALGWYASVRSLDGGATWEETEVLRGVNSAISGERADDLFATVGRDGVGWAMGFNPALGGWQVLKRTDGAHLRDASADRASPPSFYARTNDRIYRSPPFPGGFEPPVSGEDLGGPPPPEADCSIDATSMAKTPILKDSRLSPEATRVDIRVGEPEVVSYKLSVPGASPFDVYFLMDTTRSMGDSIKDASRTAVEIAETLSDSGVDVQFGLADYKDYSITPYGSGLDCPYSKRRDIGPVDESFRTAIDGLWAIGGGDKPESALTALYQTATGAGQRPWIEVGQGPTFRGGSTPVALNITDAPFHGDEPNYPGPEWAETLEALRSRGIRQVGLSYTNTAADQVDAEPVNPYFNSGMHHLRRTARETGAIAADAVDCNGDGVPDILPGGPLVCAAEGSSAPNMADAVVGMILALGDEAPVRVIETTNTGMVEIEPGGFTTVNLQEGDLLDYEITYSCAAEQAGETYDVGLAAEVRGEVVATATAVIRCLRDEIPEVLPGSDDPADVGLAAVPPLIPPPPPPPQVPPVVTGPAPGPAPAPHPQPNPQSQAQPNPQPNPQAQAGLAAQKQEQTQTATVTAGQQNAADEELAMSTRREDPIEAAKWPAAIGGAVLGLAFGCVSVAARRREQRAHAR